MTAYVFSKALPYTDYLQANGQHDELKQSISQAALSVVASIEESTRFTERMNAERSASLELKLEEINSTFQWGFSELLLAVSGVRDSLQDLIRVSKTPAQTWAYEQFEIARDAFRRGLYEEAEKYLERAIGGFGSNPGYDLEYRFHYFLGVLHIGSFRNHANKIVTPEKAEQSFLRAARCARHDLPGEAGRAFLAAGWAAYCQGKFLDALAHATEGKNLRPNLPEAHYQRAKILAHIGNCTESMAALRKAVLMDREYSLKALTDGDFQKLGTALPALLKSLRDEAAERTAISWEKLQRLSWSFTLSLGKFSIRAVEDGQRLAAIAEKAQDSIQRARASQYYFDYLDAYADCEITRTTVPAVVGTFLDRASSQLQEQIVEIEHRKAANQQSSGVPIEPSGCLLAICILIGGYILGFALTSNMSTDYGGVLVAIGVPIVAIGAMLTVCFSARKENLVSIDSELQEADHLRRQVASFWQRLNASTCV